MSNHKIRQFFYKKSRIQQFTGFCTVVQKGTILKASEKLFLDPSTISVQIKSLEGDLNIKLFERTKNHRLIPTQEGLRLYEKLIPIVQNVEGVLKEFLDEDKTKNDKNLRIAGHHVAISHILPKYIKKYLTKYPKAKIRLSNIKKTVAIDGLINDDFDFIMFPTEKNEKIPVELKSIKILKYTPVLIMNKNHPLAKRNNKDMNIKDIVKYNFIHMDKFIIFKTFMNLIKEYNIHSNIELVNGSWEIMKNLVENNIGITGFDKIYINQKKETGLIYKDISHLLPEMSHSILIRKQNNTKEHVKNCIYDIKNDPKK